MSANSHKQLYNKSQSQSRQQRSVSKVEVSEGEGEVQSKPSKELHKNSLINYSSIKEE
jgi:hypothetical protein